MKIKFFLFLLSLLLFSCGAEDTISRSYRCQFQLNTQWHPTATRLISSVTGYDSFVLVTASLRNGIWHVYATDRHGNSEDTPLTNAAESPTRLNLYNLGAQNGFFLGLTNFNGLVAWDHICPNCIAEYGGTNYPLKFTETSTIVRCSKCSRSYSLETGAVVDGGKSKSDHALMRYSAQYTGTYIVVNN